MLCGTISIWKGDGIMRSETVNFSVRLDRGLKDQADRLFSELGMTMTTAMNIFVRQSVRQGKIPFEITLEKPNEATLEAIREIEDMRSGLIPKQTMTVSDFAKEMGE
jgi:DNA-damage-inducible protein J